MKRIMHTILNFIQRISYAVWQTFWNEKTNTNTIELQLLLHRVIIHLIKIRNVLTLFFYICRRIYFDCLNSRKFKMKRITHTIQTILNFIQEILYASWQTFWNEKTIQFDRKKKERIETKINHPRLNFQSNYNYFFIELLLFI